MTCPCIRGPLHLNPSTRLVFAGVCNDSYCYYYYHYYTTTTTTPAAAAPTTTTTTTIPTTTTTTKPPAPPAPPSPPPPQPLLLLLLPVPPPLLLRLLLLLLLLLKRYQLKWPRIVAVESPEDSLWRAQPFEIQTDPWSSNHVFIILDQVAHGSAVKLALRFIESHSFLHSVVTQARKFAGVKRELARSQFRGEIFTC